MARKAADPRNSRLQRALDAAWKESPAWCEKEGLPRRAQGLDAWQMLCLEVALDDKPKQER